MSSQLLDQHEPSSTELLRIASSHVDDAMRREIAAADYGQDFDEHLEQLTAIRSGKILAPMRWEPKEVLELIRWSEPEDPTWSPGSTGDRGHWMRLFACGTLLRAAAEPANEGYFTGEDSTTVQLIDSAIKLGEKTSIAVLKFLCWCMQTRSLGDWDRPYFAVGIMVLLVRLNRCDPDTFKFLVTATNADELAHTDRFNDCLKAKTLHELIRNDLVESKNSNPDIQNFGNRLLSKR
ncbi:hypothetical protein [Novipirellula caenicola]